MTKGILVMGASGTGTTTLGQALAGQLGYKHLDTDDFYWLRTDPPYKMSRPKEERNQLLSQAMSQGPWVISGSLVDWDFSLEDHLDLLVFLWLPKSLRLERICNRERQRYGNRLEVGGDMYEAFMTFITYAGSYDQGDLTMRSRQLHDQWMGQLSCPILRLEEDLTTEARLERILSYWKSHL